MPCTAASGLCRTTLSAAARSQTRGTRNGVTRNQSEARRASLSPPRRSAHGIRRLWRRSNPATCASDLIPYAFASAAKGGAQSKAEPLHSRRLCRRSPPRQKSADFWRNSAQSKAEPLHSHRLCQRKPPSPKIRRFLAKRGGASALLLLMLRILADDHHAALAADDLALFTNRLYRRFYLHGNSYLHQIDWWTTAPRPQDASARSLPPSPAGRFLTWIAR